MIILTELQGKKLKITKTIIASIFLVFRSLFRIIKTKKKKKKTYQSTTLQKKI